MPVLGEFKAVVTAVLDQGSVEATRRGLAQGFKNTGAGQSGVEAQKAAGSWTQFGKSVAGVPNNLRVLYHTGGLGRAVDELKEARRATDEFGGALREFAPATAALAGLGSVAGFGEMLREFAEHGTQIRNIAGPLGIATQDLERWQGAAERAGVSTGAVSAAFGQLNQKIFGAAYGTDAGALGLFNQFHIAAKNADGSARQLMEVLPEVFKAFQANARDPRIQHNLLEAFGLGDLDPLFRKARDLNELMQELNESSRHGILSAEAEERAEALHRGFTNLGQSVSGFAHSLSAELAPTFGPMLKGMSDWLDKNRENERAMGFVKLAAEGVAGVIGVALVGAVAKFAQAVIGASTSVMATPLGKFLLLGYLAEHAITHGPGSEHQGDDSSDWSRFLDPRYLYRRFMPGWAGGGLSQKSSGGSSAAGVSSGGSAMPSYNPKAGNSEAMIRGAIAAAGGNAMAQAGLLSNFDYESAGLNPGAVNPNGGATGWAQWIGPRLRRLREIGDPQARETQAKLLFEELSGPYKSVIARMNAAQTPEQAAEIGLRGFEGINESNSDLAGAPWGKMLATHIAKARGYLGGAAAALADGQAAATPTVSQAGVPSGRRPDGSFTDDNAGVRARAAAGNDQQWSWPFDEFGNPKAGFDKSGNPKVASPKTGRQPNGSFYFPLTPDVAGAKAADSHHQVDFNITGAPSGSRADVNKSTGPADFNLRVEHAMATP